ncbi:MAG TPA: hypothetical protein VL175_04810 [Pirellulales bacterium]|jgi:hypothetical protein|nr:hypothetical protein [Pirellulales bacterium]
MNIDRRRLLSRAMTGAAAACAIPSWATLAHADEPSAAKKSQDQPTDPVRVRDGDELQRLLDNKAASGGGVVRLARDSELTCLVRHVPIARETSIHALLVPQGVALDLNGSTLRLDMRSNSYGVRLAARSAISGGTIKVVGSAGKGSQAIWHSAVSVGAAYGDGGTVAQPGHFSTVGQWRIENMTIEQPFEAACIQLMSEAHHGVIRNIRILDSPKALIGIGLDWGTVGPVATADELVPSMRKLWEKHEISSTHPHHVLIENISVGKLARSVDGNDAGVRCSGCHHITIRNLTVETAMAAVALFGGDFGFEFAPDEQRREAHAGYLVDGVKIAAARLYGIVMNGAEDNVYRSRLNFGYDSLRDPVHPGLDKPIVRNAVIRGTRAPHSRGVYLAAATGAVFENVDVEGFETGVAVNDWVRSSTFRNGRIANNQENIHLGATSEAPGNASFENNADH